jgi:hypothetical protein
VHDDHDLHRRDRPEAQRVVPADLLQAAALEADVPTKRRRKPPADVTLLLCMAMSL